MDAAQALVNAVSNLVQPFWTAILGLAGLLAMGFVLRTGYRVAQANYYPGTQAVSGYEVLTALVLAACLANYSSFASVISRTLGMGSVTFTAIDYSGASTFGSLAPAVNAVLTMASMAGGMYILKGLVTLRQASIGGGHAPYDAGWRGVVHIIAGLFFVDIVQVLNLLDATTGGLW